MPHSVQFDRQAALAQARILRDVKPVGPVIGRFADVAFHACIRDDAGHRYGYAGVAHRSTDGGYDCSHLAASEFVLPPGIIYQRREV